MQDKGTSQTSPPEAEGTGNPTPEAEGQETGRQSEPKEDYAEKFRASAREAQRLLDENRKLAEREAALNAKLSAVEREKLELEELAKGNNPEGYDSARLRRHVESLNADIAKMKEGLELDSFVGQVPEAGEYRDVLRDLGRAYPGRQYREIWETSLKAVAESAREAREARQERKRSSPDMGGGSPTGEPQPAGIFGMPLEKFNALSLEKRKELFKKHGIHYERPTG